jgi:hypothetical protein
LNANHIFCVWAKQVVGEGTRLQIETHMGVAKKGLRKTANDNDLGF